MSRHFNPRLKSKNIPEWDGNEDSSGSWITATNLLSERDPVVYNQLGEQVPDCLCGRAKRWFFSLPIAYRTQAMTNWGTLKDCICSYFMNRARLDRQKG